MPQSFTRIILHTTFSTKYREPTITPDVEPELLRYMAKLFNNHGAVVIEINAALDHVHIVHAMPRTIALSYLIQQVKRKSSLWISHRFRATHRGFTWQVGFASHSADYRRLEGLINYVRNQKAHHKLESFVQEFLKLLRVFRIDHQEEFLFPDRPQENTPRIRGANQ